MEYLSVDQIASDLKVHRNTVENWLRTGKLRGVKLGGDKLWRVSRESLDKFLEKD